MTARKVSKAGIRIYGTKGGVLVIGATSVQVRRAMRLLERKLRKDKEPDRRAKTALKFFDVAERFFKQGGRFKVKYQRKSKAKK